MDELEGAVDVEEKGAKKFDAIQKGENAGFLAEGIVITFLVLWLFSHSGADFHGLLAFHLV